VYKYKGNLKFLGAFLYIFVSKSICWEKHCFRQ